MAAFFRFQYVGYVDTELTALLPVFCANLIGNVAGMYLFREYLRGTCGARVVACWMHVQDFRQARDTERRAELFSAIRRHYLHPAVTLPGPGCMMDLVATDILNFPVVPAGQCTLSSTLSQHGHLSHRELEPHSRQALRHVQEVLELALHSYWLPCYICHVLTSQPTAILQVCGVCLVALFKSSPEVQVDRQKVVCLQREFTQVVSDTPDSSFTISSFDLKTPVIEPMPAKARKKKSKKKKHKPKNEEKKDEVKDREEEEEKHIEEEENVIEEEVKDIVEDEEKEIEKEDIPILEIEAVKVEEEEEEEIQKEVEQEEVKEENVTEKEEDTEKEEEMEKEQKTDEKKDRKKIIVRERRFRFGAERPSIGYGERFRTDRRYRERKKAVRGEEDTYRWPDRVQDARAAPRFSFSVKRDPTPDDLLTLCGVSASPLFPSVSHVHEVHELY
ncbi:hypothetical protein ACOMHN_036666 [Nucella lapillus]